MRNFLRAVRNSWPFRVRLTLSILCAVFAAVFWSLSFLAIHPAMKILGGETTLPKSVDKDIENIESDLQKANLRRQDLERQLRELDPASNYRDDKKREITGAIAQTE